MKIALMAGHSGKDGGAVTGPKGYSEHSLALEVIPRIKELLEEAGHTVAVTERSKAGGTTPLYSAVAANDVDADMAVELHFNSADSASANGSEVLHYGHSSRSKKIAEAMLASWCSQSGLRSRGVLPVHSDEADARKAGHAGRYTTRGWSAFRRSDMPFFMVEPFFSSNAQETAKVLAWVKSGEYARMLSRAILAGVSALRG